MKKDIKFLAWQGILFYDLENEYLNEWGKRFPEDSRETVKKAFRKKVNNKHIKHHIELTEVSAKKILNKLV